MLTEETIEFIHKQLDNNNERALFSIYCHTSYRGLTALYMDIRESLDGKEGILYTIFDTGRNDSLLFKACCEFLNNKNTDNKPFNEMCLMLESFDFIPFTERVLISPYDYLTIKQNLVSIPPFTDPFIPGGSDGHIITFNLYIGDNPKYMYWVKPPDKYNQLQSIMNILSKYINNDLRNRIYRPL